MVMAQDLVAGDGASASIEDATPAADLCPTSGAGNAELRTDYDTRGLVDSVDSSEDHRSSALVAGENGEEAPTNGALETQEREQEPGGNGGEAERMREDLEIEEKNGEVGLRGVNSQSVSENKVNGLGRSYARGELEALRFVGTGEQRQRWKEVYQKLGSVVAQEYDELRDSIPLKKKRGGKKKEKETSLIMGELLAVNTEKSSDVPDSADLVCSDAYVDNENCTIMEDMCDEYENIIDEDDSSSDEHESIQRPAFLVEGEPDFDSGPPLDGLEYLRRVRWEAAQIPKVKVAKLNLSNVSSEQTPYMPKIPEIAKCPQNLLPAKDWEEAFLANFSEIRQAFSLLENSPDQQPSARKSSDNSCKQSDSAQQPKCIPTVPLVRGMDAVSRAATLRNYISMLESASGLSRDDCLWLFALCVAVDTPLNADTCASLRCLLRKCSSLLAGKSEPDDEVAMLNILITITGKYFGQLEDARCWPGLNNLNPRQLGSEVGISSN